MAAKTHPTQPSARPPGARPAVTDAGGTADLASLLARLDTTQAELDALYPQLERLNRLASIGTIAGMIAHEFNNILTPMLSYAQMAAAAPNDLAMAQKALQRTIAGSERAAKVADAILGFVRDEEEKGKSGSVFHVEHLSASACKANVASVVSEAFACMARDASRDGIDLHLSIPEGANVAIQPIALQQVLVNLVLNARNAMGSNGGRLEISATSSRAEPESAHGAADSRRAQTDASQTTRACSTWNTPATLPVPASWISIHVRDSGCGISPDHLAGMFTPFRSGSTGRVGTGLGMVITKRLVEAAGGWLVVESKRGSGTTVIIVLRAA